MLRPNLEPSSVVDQKSAWHGDLYTQTGEGRNGGKKRGREDRWLCVFYKTNVEFGVKNLGWVYRVVKIIIIIIVLI